MPALTSLRWLCRPSHAWTALIALALLAGPAHTQEAIEGPACVVDGRTLFVGGTREQGQCRGGIKVRLHGIDAPDLEQRCATQTGASYACGTSALNALEELTWRRSLHCEPQGPAGRDRAIPATCIAAEQDLGAELVRRGWAIADMRQGDAYAGEQAEARAARRGLWGGRFDDPAAWRQERRR